MADTWEDIELQQKSRDTKAGRIVAQSASSPTTLSVPMPVTFQPSTPRGSCNSELSLRSNMSHNSNAPQGIERLGPLEQVFVKQWTQYFEASGDSRTEKHYDIVDSRGRKILSAHEGTTDCCMAWGKSRPFHMKLLDRNEEEIIQLSRPCACSFCCLPCSSQTLNVESPPGTLIGSVMQNWSVCVPQYNVTDETGQTIYWIRETDSTSSDGFGDGDFQIFHAEDRSSEMIGKLSRTWPDLANGHFSNHAGIKFPPGASPEMKAILLGTCLLINSLFFESTGNKSQ